MNTQEQKLRDARIAFRAARDVADQSDIAYNAAVREGRSARELESLAWAAYFAHEAAWKAACPARVRPEERASWTQAAGVFHARGRKHAQEQRSTR